MHTSPLDANQLHQLEQLVAKNAFLSLSNSKDAYPESLGSGLPILLINTSLCSASISLQGAHLLEFKPAQAAPILWLSPNCEFSPGVALRGGIPLCLPWFGPNPTDANKPKHGFARNNFWQLADAQQHADGRVELGFLFVAEANPLFAYDFSAELRMTLGNEIRLDLTINNTDELDFNCSWAMHTYFKVDTLNQVRVTGLKQRHYKDNLENHAVKFQNTDVSFEQTIDRVFAGVENSLTIVNRGMSENIEISHHNCPSVVTWNPGKLSADIADIGEDNQLHFICVERGAVLEETWSLASGTSNSAWMVIKAQQAD